MKKILYSLLLVSSYAVAMKQQDLLTIDPALVPTHDECKHVLKNNSSSGWQYCSDEVPLVHAFAQHGPIESFHKKEHYILDDFADNELMSWAISQKSSEIVKVLLARSIAQSVGVRSWRAHIRTALEGLQDDVAAQLLGAKPDCAENEGAWVNEHAWGETLLQTAALNLCTTFAKTLLEGNFGVQVDACPERFKKTPLQLCAERANQSMGWHWSEPYFSEKKRDMLSLLLKHGANPDVKITRRTEGSMWSPSQAYTEPFVDWCISEKFGDCLVPLVEQKKINGSTLVKEEFSHEKQPLLNWAVRVGSLPLVQAMVPAEGKPSFFYLDNHLLWDALRFQHKDIVDHLATHPLIERRKSTGQCVMRAAVSNGWLDVADTMVEQHGRSIAHGVDDWYKKMALLHTASGRGDVRMVQQLLDWGCDVAEEGDNGQLPIDAAVSANNPKILSVLLAAGSPCDAAKTTSLRTAFQAYETSPAVFEQLLAYEPNRDHVRQVCIEATGKTPVEYAVDKGYRMTQVMLEAGFDAHDYIEESPIGKVSTKDSEFVALLLRYGANPDIIFGHGDNLLHNAGGYGSVETLSLLFDAGLQSREDARGLTPLLHAVSGNTPEAVACLLDKSDPGVMQEIAYTLVYTDISQTLFEYAVHQRRNNVAPVCQLLLDRGADLERVNELGETPVFWAMRNNRAEALEWLVAHGARLDVVNHEGETPLSILACQIEWTQKEMLMAVLQGLSASVGGLVSVEDALEHSIHYRLNTFIPDEQVCKWKQSMKFDPFEKMRAYCGTGLHKEYGTKPTLTTRLNELEQDICKHGAYLFREKMGRAFQNNEIETVRQFIATGIDLRTFDVQHGATVLHWAARHGHHELLVELLERHGLKDVINKETIHKCSALSEAGTVECAQVLIDNGAAITKNVLSELVYKDKEEVVMYILSRSDPAVCTPEDIQRIYESAVRHGNALIAANCLEVGAKSQEFDLERAVCAEHVGVVAALKHKGISVVSAQKKARERQYSPEKSFAAVAVDKKNLALLNEVIETADDSLLPVATYCSWHEGLAVLLGQGMPETYEAQDKLLSEAIRVSSLACCKLLVEHKVPVTLEHLERATDSTHEIMQFLLQQVNTSQQNLDRLLYKAIKKLKPAICAVLLEHGANLSAVDARKQRTWFHIIADKANLFGLSSRHGVNYYHPNWQQRVKNVAWLNAYKQHMLESNESIETLKAPDKDVQDLVDTLYVLMTSPVYGSAQEHKKILYRLLQKSCVIDDNAYTPFALVHKTCNSSTFNDLLDPEKIKQWHAAIDREYAAKAKRDHEVN